MSKIRMAGGRADTAAGTPCIGADATLLCSDGLGCSTDFLLIPNSGGQGFLKILCVGVLVNLLLGDTFFSWTPLN